MATVNDISTNLKTDILVTNVSAISPLVAIFHVDYTGGTVLLKYLKI